MLSGFLANADKRLAKVIRLPGKYEINFMGL